MKVREFWTQADESVLKYVEVGCVRKFFIFEEIRLVERWLERNPG